MGRPRRSEHEWVRRGRDLGPFTGKVHRARRDNVDPMTFAAICSNIQLDVSAAVGDSMVWEHPIEPELLCDRCCAMMRAHPNRTRS